MKKFTKINENIDNNTDIDITVNIDSNDLDLIQDIQVTGDIPIVQKNDGFNENYNTKNLILEICTIMVLLNNNFLDELLDGGNKNRYTKNTKQFVLDLKTLMITPNRLKFGKFNDGKCIEEDAAFANKYFDLCEFSIDTDWNQLVNSRNIARGIIDKLIDGDKLTPDQIKCIYWCAPNSVDIKADIVIETNLGNQYSIKLNVNNSFTKSSSFISFGRIFIGNNTDKLFDDNYKITWDLLSRNWVKLIYENTKPNLQLMIEKFISPDRIDYLTWDEFINAKHSDSNYANLGEYVSELDAYYKDLSKLLSDIWKKRKDTFTKPFEVYQAWSQFKIQNLNSKLIEHLFTSSLNANNIKDLQKYAPSGNINISGSYINVSGSIKINIINMILDSVNSCETDIYFINKSGSELNKIPNRQWFRDNLDNIQVIFDYHTLMVIDNKDEENNNFKMNIKLIYKETEIFDCWSKVMFSGGEMSGKLTSKTIITIPNIFNHIEK